MVYKLLNNMMISTSKPTSPKTFHPIMLKFYIWPIRFEYGN